LSKYLASITNPTTAYGPYAVLWYIIASRAGLEPMQPMQLHWAPRLWRPPAMVLGQDVHFCQILLALENCGNVLWISLLANNYLVWTNDEFPVIIERYQMCSIWC